MLEPEYQPKDSQALSQAAFGTGQGSPPEEAEGSSQKEQERLPQKIRSTAGKV